jgi:hypothetical protein
MRCETCGHLWSDHDPRDPHISDDLQVGCVFGWGAVDGCSCKFPNETDAFLTGGGPKPSTNS